MQLGAATHGDASGRTWGSMFTPWGCMLIPRNENYYFSGLNSTVGRALKITKVVKVLRTWESC